MIEAEESATIALQDQIVYVNVDINDEQVEESKKDLLQTFDAFVEYRDELMNKYNAIWGEETSIPGVQNMEKE